MDELSIEQTRHMAEFIKQRQQYYAEQFAKDIVVEMEIFLFKNQIKSEIEAKKTTLNSNSTQKNRG